MSLWIVQTLVMSSLLMLFVLASRRAVAQWFGARVAYALWLIPLARMILPPVPGHHPLFEAMTGLPQLATPHIAAAEAAGALPPGVIDLPPDVASAFDAPPVPAGPDWVSLLIGLWLAGAALFFGWQMLRYRLFVGRAMRGATHLSTSAGVDIFASDGVEGPIASGVFHRRIFLPRDFLDRYTSGERRQALLHEGAHHDRGDLLANVVAIGIVSLHWWNPLAHFAYRCFRADQELACDATVLADAEPDQLYAYGSALVKSTVGRTPAAACAFNRTDEIKRRLTMIKRGRLGFGRRSAGVALAAVATAAGLAATASGSHAAVRIDPAVTPTAPAAPVPAEGTFAPVVVKPAAMVAEASPPAPPAPPAPAAAPAAPPPPVHVTRIHRRMDGTVTVERSVETQAEARERAHAEAEAARDRGQALRDRGQALRDKGQALRDQAEADRDQRQAERDRALAARDAARDVKAEVRVSNVRVLVANSLNQARAEMASACAAKGTPVSPNERDWGKLALCDKAAFNAQVIHSMEEARAEVARDGKMDSEGRAKALDALDGAIARMKARGVS